MPHILLYKAIHKFAMSHAGELYGVNDEIYALNN